MQTVFQANKIESSPRVRVPELSAIEKWRPSGDDSPHNLRADPEMRCGLHFKQKVVPHHRRHSGKANRRLRDLFRKENVGGANVAFKEAQQGLRKNLDQVFKSRTNYGMFRKKVDTLADIGWLHGTMTQFHADHFTILLGPWYFSPLRANLIWRPDRQLY
jgi:hypothetical protein